MFLGEIKRIYEGINILNYSEDFSLEDLAGLLFYIIFPDLPHYVRSRIASHWEIGICQESELDHKSTFLHQPLEHNQPEDQSWFSLSKRFYLSQEM